MYFLKEYNIDIIDLKTKNGPRPYFKLVNSGFFGGREDGDRIKADW